METANESFEANFKSQNISLNPDKNIPPFGDLKAKTTALYVEIWKN